MKLKSTIRLTLIFSLILSVHSVSGLAFNSVLPSTQRSISFKSESDINLPINYLIYDSISISSNQFVIVGSTQPNNVERTYGWIRIYSNFVMTKEVLIGDVITKNDLQYDFIQTELISVQKSSSQIFLLGNSYHQNLQTNEFVNSSFHLILDFNFETINFDRLTMYPNFRGISAKVLPLVDFQVNSSQTEIGYLYYIVQEYLLSTSGLPITINLYLKQHSEQILLGPYYFESVLNSQSIGFAPFGTDLIYFQVNIFGQLKATAFIENTEIPGPYIQFIDELFLSSIDVVSLDASIVVTQYGIAGNELSYTISSISPVLDTLNWYYELPTTPSSRYNLLGRDNAAYLSYSSISNNQYILNVAMILDDGTITNFIEMDGYYATHSMVLGKEILVLAYKNGQVYGLVFEDELKYAMDQIIDGLTNFIFGGGFSSFFILACLVILSFFIINKKRRRSVKSELYPNS